MSLKDRLTEDMQAAMKSGDKLQVGTLRMLSSAIKNRDIELRTASSQPDDDALVTEDGHWYVAGLFGEDALVLLDLWGKLKAPGAVFADITWVAFTGQAVPARMSVRSCSACGSRRRRATRAGF